MSNNSLIPIKESIFSKIKNFLKNLFGQETIENYELEIIKNSVIELEIETMFDGVYDKSNCYLELFYIVKFKTLDFATNLIEITLK